MASSSANPMSFLFVVITLLSPLQLLAREPQLFSKVTHNTDQIDNNNNNIVVNNDVKETEADATFSTKEAEEQVPSFRPQTQTRYGLFSHELSQDDPVMEKVNNNNEGERVYKYNNMDDLVMAERAGYMHSTRSADINNYDVRRRQNNMGTHEDPYYFQNNNNVNYNVRVRQQGMSDTRFLENGKYFYDLNKESYNPNAYQNMRALALSSNNVYNTAGANYNSDNHNDDAYYNNAMERYRNHLHFQDTVDQQFMP